jgi:hypothetical protein
VTLNTLGGTAMMVSLRKTAALLCLLAASLVVEIVSPVPEAEAQQSCGTNVNTQVGFSTNNYQGSQPMRYDGVSARITDRPGYILCTTDTNGGTNFITTWDMVFSNSGNGYAQSGTMYRYGYAGCVKRWAEQNVSQGQQDYYAGGCSAENETHTYWQQIYNLGTSYAVRSNIDGTVLAQSPGNPYNYWQLPFQIALDAESYYPIEAIPGRNATRQDYDGIQVQRFTDDVFVGACGNINLGQFNNNPGRWNVTAPNCDHTQTWNN